MARSHKIQSAASAADTGPLADSPSEPEGDRRGRSRVTGILALLALLSAALPGLFGHSGEAGAPITPESERRGFVAFTLPDDTGGTYDLRSRSAGKVTLINFWATWCRPCREEVPALGRITEQYKPQGLETVGVSLDTNGPDAVRSFASDWRMPYPIAMGANSPVAAYSSQGIPLTIVLDRRGRVAKTILGVVDENALSQDIATLLKEPAGKSSLTTGSQNPGNRVIPVPLPPLLFGR